MSNLKSPMDLYMIYEFIKRLSRPFNEQGAFKTGIINADGKLLKSPVTKEEKDSYTYFDRLIINLKRLLKKLNLESRVGTFAAAMFLLKEHNDRTYKNYDYQELKKVLIENINNMDKTIFEDVIANATGSAVAGTGDSGVHWSHRQPKNKKNIPYMNLLKRRKYREIIKNQ